MASVCAADFVELGLHEHGSYHSLPQRSDADSNGLELSEIRYIEEPDSPGVSTRHTRRNIKQRGSRGGDVAVTAVNRMTTTPARVVASVGDAPYTFPTGAAWTPSPAPVR